MFYVSIDIETTGLNIANCDVLEFAAIIDDLANPKPLEELPKFHAYIAKRSYKGEPHALSMHANILKKIGLLDFKLLDKEGIYISETNERYMTIEQLPQSFKYFLEANLPNSLISYNKDTSFSSIKKLNVAGKNVSNFDIPFLQDKIKNWHGVSFSSRCIDPAILYYQPGDLNLPDTKTCMERAGIEGEVAHTALEDALVVVQLLRNKILK